MTRWRYLVQRMANGCQQSFIRFGIWRHTLELAAQNPFDCWLDEQLSFINLWGDSITTTHSLYLAALLKGDATGALLLALLISYSFIMAKRQCDRRQSLEGALCLFAVGFYLTQGMFLLSAIPTSPGRCSGFRWRWDNADVARPSDRGCRLP
ncbi:MAG: hypothetical protein GPOALKHO_001076 [Sodalis sp.]|uniref:hypothetical protein n=1 Tax=Sodalis sp. (in: enterobacteria) TaxID=1898979 RepID=UPI003873113D|nr:MAG: hypothetical protein GPOALKHO_001076 [Sodalis sp.]